MALCEEWGCEVAPRLDSCFGGHDVDLWDLDTDPLSVRNLRYLFVIK